MDGMMQGTINGAVDRSDPARAGEPRVLSTPSGPVYFEHRLAGVLREAVLTGRLTAAVVATPNGLPLAASNADGALNILAGLSSLFGEIAQRSEQLLGWPTVEEVSLVDPRGQRLVTRRFGVGELSLLLVVLVPANRAYRRVTSQALRRLKALYERPDESRD